MKRVLALALTLLAAAGAAAPAQACQVGPFRVYYDADGQPRAEAMAAIADAARYWTGLPDDHRRVLITGHTDSVGDAGDNLVASAERARWVANALMAHGVMAGSIVLVAYGESKPEAATGDNVAEPLNRSVKIHMDTASTCPAPPPAPKAQ